MKIGLKIVLILVVLAGLFGIAYYVDQQKSENDTGTGIIIEQPYNNGVKIEEPDISDNVNDDVATRVLQSTPIIGEQNAQNIMVMFTDFKCLSCKEWVDNILPDIKAEFIDTKQAKLHIVDLAFIGEDSALGAVAGDEIYRQDPGSYLKFFELMFQNQKAESETWITKEFLNELVSNNFPNIDLEQFNKALNENSYTEKILDYDTFASNSSVAGTPTLLFNNQKIFNPFDIQEFKDILEGKDPRENKIAQFLDIAPYIGDKNAPVSVIEVIDFKCPFCRQWATEVAPLLKDEFINKGQVKLSVIPLAFLGPDSLNGAMVAQEIFNQNPSEFEKYYTKMFEKQGNEATEWITPDFIYNLIKEEQIDVDLEQLGENLQNQVHQDIIQSYTNFSNYMLVTGTPTVFVNGKKVENPYDYNLLKNEINQYLK